MVEKKKKVKEKKIEVVKAHGAYTAEAPTVQDLYQDINKIHKKSEYVSLGRPITRKVRITPKRPKLRR